MPKSGTKLKKWAAESCVLKTAIMFGLLAGLVAVSSYLWHAAAGAESLLWAFMSWTTQHNTTSAPATIIVWLSCFAAISFICSAYKDHKSSANADLYKLFTGIGLLCLVTAPAGFALLQMPNTVFDRIQGTFLAHLGRLAQAIGVLSLCVVGVVGVVLVALLLCGAFVFIRGFTNSLITSN